MKIFWETVRLRKTERKAALSGKTVTIRKAESMSMRWLCFCREKTVFMKNTKNFIIREHILLTKSKNSP